MRQPGPQRPTTASVLADACRAHGSAAYRGSARRRPWPLLTIVGEEERGFHAPSNCCQPVPGRQVAVPPPCVQSFSGVTVHLLTQRKWIRPRAPPRTTACTSDSGLGQAPPHEGVHLGGWRRRSVWWSDCRTATRRQSAREAIPLGGAQGMKLAAASVTDNRLVQQRIDRVVLADGTIVSHASVGAGGPLVYVMGWLTHLQLSWELPAERALYEALGAGLSTRARRPSVAATAASCSSSNSNDGRRFAGADSPHPARRRSVHPRLGISASRARGSVTRTCLWGLGKRVGVSRANSPVRPGEHHPRRVIGQRP